MYGELLSLPSWPHKCWEKTSERVATRRNPWKNPPVVATRWKNPGGEGSCQPPFPGLGRPTPPVLVVENAYLVLKSVFNSPNWGGEVGLPGGGGSGGETPHHLPGKSTQKKASEPL